LETVDCFAAQTERSALGGEGPDGVGTASSRDRKAVFGVALPASTETKVGSALDSGLSNSCATTSPNDCKVGGTVNTADGGHRQQPLHC
jgi:hypothetical protein